MKKLLLLITVATLSLCAPEAKAQLTYGSVAPDWTFTDINGQSWNLYTELNAGKTVFIDISAAWCAPCWDYHQSKALDSLYTLYGPSGTNEVNVFWIEGQLTNTSTQLNGTSTGTTTATYTQGNWVTGTPYPIIDLPNNSLGTAFMTNYQIGGFPTIYAICPDRIVREVGQAPLAYLTAAKTACPTVATVANDPALITYTGTQIACSNASLSVILQNHGTSPLTTCTITATDGTSQLAQLNWTGSLATYATQNVTVGNITLTSSPTLSITITSPDNDATNNTISTYIVYKQPLSLPTAEDFETFYLPYYLPLAWESNNVGNDADAQWLVGGSSSSFYGGYGNSQYMAFLEFYYSPVGSVDELITTQFDLSAATAPVLTFDLAYAQWSTQNDKLEVFVSTDCGATWTSKYSKSGSTLKTASPTTSYFIPTSSQWRTDFVDLTSLAGQPKVLVKFKGTSAYGNNLFIDNVNVAPAGAGVHENASITSMNVFPNPVNINPTVAFDMQEAQNVTINIYDVLSRKVYSQNEGALGAGFHSVTLRNNELGNGVYFITLTTEKGSITQKIVVNK